MNFDETLRIAFFLNINGYIKKVFANIKKIIKLI